MSDEGLEDFFAKAKKVKLIAIGVDGVLTDAGMYFSANGDMMRKFNRRDGMGIQLLKKSGIKSAVISSMDSGIVAKWAETFGVDFTRQGAANKLHEIEKLQIRMGIRLDEIAYISDDIDEMDILTKVGFGVTVQDGMKTNKNNSVYVTKRKGGEGAVRELIEIVLAAKRT